MAEEKDLEKVRALIARTSSSSEEEARTCAFLACAKIRELGLELTIPFGGASVSASTAEIRDLRMKNVHLQSAVERLQADLRRKTEALDGLQLTVTQLRKKVEAAPAAAKSSSTASKTSRKPAAKKQGPAPKGFQAMDGFYDTKRITAKYNSRCRACGDEISEGEQCIWTPGEGVQCLPCGEG